MSLTSFPTSPSFPWIKKSELGRGGYGVVWRVQHKDQPNEERALKIMKMTEKDERLSNEIIFHRNACKQSPYIVRVDDIFVDSAVSRVFIVMELCWGTLSEFLRIQGGYFANEQHTLKFCRHLALGLATLKRLGAVHRDLKPDNLLMTSASPATAVLKLADFGFARNLPETVFAYSLVGSPQWMAPEIAIDRKYTSQADLWSVGAILYQMVSGSPPPNQFKDLQQFVDNHVRSRFVPVPITDYMKAHCSPPLIDLLTRLLEKNPADRLTFQEFLAHPWLGLSLEEQNSCFSSPSPSPSHSSSSSPSSSPSHSSSSSPSPISPSSSPSSSSPPIVSSSSPPPVIPAPPSIQSSTLTQQPSSSAAAQKIFPSPFLSPPSSALSTPTTLDEALALLASEHALRLEYEARVADTTGSLIQLLTCDDDLQLSIDESDHPPPDRNRTFWELDRIMDLFIELQKKTRSLQEQLSSP